MAEPASPPDIAITGVTVSPPVVTSGSQFTVNVTVFAPDEDFEDGVAYRLFVYACACAGNPPVNITPNPLTGHVQDAPWATPTSTISFTMTAGSTPDIYDIKAVLLEGPRGVPDSDDPPSVFCADCALIVIPAPNTPPIS